LSEFDAPPFIAAPASCATLHSPIPGRRHFFSIQGFTHADGWGIIRRLKAGAG